MYDTGLEASLINDKVELKPMPNFKVVILILKEYCLKIEKSKTQMSLIYQRIAKKYHNKSLTFTSSLLLKVKHLVVL